jgi:small subunit ribosomal protein S5
LDVRRTARVVKGGRRFTFRVTVVIGNRNGKVGLGMGKGADVSSAVDKAVNQAKKQVFEIPLTKSKSIPHMVYAKAGAARVLLKPAREGRGMTAGGPIRVVSELAGIKNLTGKILSRTSNKLNNARAVMDALRELKVRV